METVNEKKNEKKPKTLNEILKDEEFLKDLKSIAKNKEDVPALIQSFKEEVKGKGYNTTGNIEKLLSILAAAAKSGVDFSHPNNECYIFPRAGQPSIYIGYKGLLKIAFQSKMILNIVSDVVYEGDVFHFKNGLNPEIYHEPVLNRKGDEKILGYYGALEMFNGKTKAMWMPEETFDLKYKKPALKNAKGGPWVDHPDEMARKTIIKKLLKLVPALREAPILRVKEQQILENNPEDEPKSREGAEDSEKQ